MVQVKTEEGLRGVNLDDEVIDAKPCAVFHGNCRSAAVRRAIGPTRSSRTGWSEEEDYLLRQVVKRFHGRSWKKIAECLPGRTANQCFSRWKRVLDPSIFKGTWTKEEDDCIRESVGKYGRRNWSVIARSLPGRLGKQCRERWYNHLDPTNKKTVWTEYEDQTLTRYHEIYGNKWSKIARFLDGRSDNTIKNRWNWLVKKKFDSYLPCTSGMDWQIVDSSNIYSCDTKPDCMELIEGRHSVKIAEYCQAGMRGPLGGVDVLTHVTIPDDRGPDSSVASDVFEITDKEENISTSPESTLREFARTFKNTPSIIRKRSCRETGIATPSDIAWTPSSNISCMNPREASNGKRILHMEQDFLVFSLSRDLHLWFNMCDKDTGPLTPHLKE